VKAISAGNSCPEAGSGQPAPCHELSRGIPPPDSGFTLLEIIIALSLVAILVSASIPYLFDYFSNSAGERAAESIVTTSQEAREKAITTGKVQSLTLESSAFDGASLPKGWKLQVKGLNDAKFHAPERGATWGFTSAGICEPLVLKLVGDNRSITLPFDALTGQVLHNDE
jgi:prepilin-type N-terminal cleavage/methylation domain-containing protein